MPGLNQAGEIASDCLEKNLAKYRYQPTLHTLELLKHTSWDIFFALVVDNFGIKYSNREDAEHLRNALQLWYPVTTYWTRSKKMGLTHKLDYINRTVDLFMPNYISVVINKFHHKAP